MMQQNTRINKRAKAKRWPLWLVIGVLAVVGFYVVQYLGMFRFIGKIISKLANAEDWHSLVHSGQTLDDAIRKLYARRSGVIGCCVWTAGSLVIGSGEIWIALHALGLHATAVNAVILQSMVLTIRSAVFPVPVCAWPITSAPLSIAANSIVPLIMSKPSAE